MLRRLHWFIVLPLLVSQLLACAGTTAPTQSTGVPTTASTVGATSPTSGRVVNLNVFAAASLTESFTQLGKDFEKAYPGTKVTFNFAGSQELDQQINQGAPADVFASADQAHMDVVVKSGMVDPAAPRTFVRNRLVVVYPIANPAKLHTLQDLAKPGIKIVLADKSVPVGSYALTYLDKASKDPAFGATYKANVLKNVVSYEQDVKAVLSKVILDAADAGIVYTTDVTPDAADKVGTLDIPDQYNTIASYPIAPIKGSKHAELAQKFVAYVLSPAGQTVLAKFGFIPTKGSPTGAALPKRPLALSGLIDKPLSVSTEDLPRLPQAGVTATDKGVAPTQDKGVAIFTTGVKSLTKREVR